MSNNPLVSIIVPVYKVEKYLNNCLQSLVNQVYKNIEILLIDDGSPDNSGAICDEWEKKDNRIKVIHKKNEGVSAARNLGIQEARGKYFVCVDSDDYVKPNYVENLIRARMKFPEAGHIWSGFQTVNDDSGAAKKIYIADESKQYSIFDRSQIKTLSKMWLDASPWMRLYDRSIVINSGIQMDTTISVGEDKLFNYEYLDIVNNTTIVVVNEATYCYRYQDNYSLDTKYYADLLGIYEYNIQKEITFLKKWDLSENEWNKFWNSRFYLYEKGLRNTFRKENKESFFKKLKYNSMFMKSNKYKSTYENFTGYLNPLLKKAYSCDNYIWVLILQKMFEVKSKFIGLFKS